MKCEEILGAFLHEQAAILLIDLDSNGIVRQANQFTRRFLGCDPVGQSIKELFLDFQNEDNVSYE